MLPEQALTLGWGDSVLPDYYGLMRFLRLILALSLTVLGSVFIAGAASAHTDVVSTSPTDGSVLEVPPAIISVTFSEPPITEGAAIVLADVSGTEIQLGDLAIEGATISVASPPDLLPGEYKATWRISAEDGHALTGEFGFTYNGDAVVTNASPMMTAYATDVAAQNSVGAGVEKSDATSDSNSWIILLASFVASATIGTIYAAKKRNK